MVDFKKYKPALDIVLVAAQTAVRACNGVEFFEKQPRKEIGKQVAERVAAAIMNWVNDQGD